MININGKHDESYRYKMPPIKTSIKNNEIILLNLNDICKYINQPSILILKFLSLYFGSKLNEEKMSITGNYSDDELQKALQIYINRLIN